MSSKKKTQGGITLISLVITIIVLLILATVAISIAIDSNGLFERARKAAEDWNTSVADEERTIENVFEILNEVNVGGIVGGGEMQPPSETQTEANRPVIPDGVDFQYVTWEEKNGKYEEKLTSKEDGAPDNWYNYDDTEKKWANIKTQSTTINDDGTYNEAYWVWIPRYAYQVPARPTSTSNSDGMEFKIAFLQGNTNETVNPEVLNGKTIKTATELGNYDGNDVGEWIVHPAFTFGDQELSGIWVAKFEASSNTTTPNANNGGGNDITDLYVNVKPDTISWKNIIVNNIFIVCQAMDETNGALEGAKNADPHMMKNVEWGAIVYLAQSKYGKNEQVWNNPNNQYRTGQAGNSKDDSDKSSTNNYNTENGPQASTTGNVYGIYDMAGGSHEYVAAYVNNGSINLSNCSQSLLDANAKYKDVYSVASSDSNTNNYNANTNKYGDAVYETSFQEKNYTSWQKDYSNFPYANNPVFVRGGSYNNNEYSGLFSFSNANGSGYGGHSFRPVCISI